MKRVSALVRLRIAAKAWADGLRLPVEGDDKAFRKLDIQLQKAALRFAASK